MCLYEITRFLRETYQYMPKKVSNPSSYKFDMFSTGPGMLGYPNSGGVSVRRNERSTKPVIGSVISNDSNNNSMITTTMIRPDMPSQSAAGNQETRRTGIEISGVGHSSNDNISFADLNSDINLKHISFAINKDGILKSHKKHV